MYVVAHEHMSRQKLRYIIKQLGGLVRIIVAFLTYVPRAIIGFSVGYDVHATQAPPCRDWVVTIQQTTK